CSAARNSWPRSTPPALATRCGRPSAPASGCRRCATSGRGRPQTGPPAAPPVRWPPPPLGGTCPPFGGRGVCRPDDVATVVGERRLSHEHEQDHDPRRIP